MSEQSLFLSRVIVGCIIQDRSLLAEFLTSANPDDLDAPYGQTITAIMRIPDTETIDPWSLQQSIQTTVPGTPDNFIGGLATEGMTVAFPYYLSQFREGIARRRLASVAEMIGVASRMEDLQWGIERVKELILDAESILTPQTIPLLDGQLLWDYEAPADAVLIPGLLWRQARAVFTGFEGDGKSIILRQLALAGALGLHPFKPHGRVDPIRTLYIDLENPATIAQTVMRQMLETLRDRRLVPDHADLEGRMMYDIQTGGLDIVGKGRDREHITRAIATHRPDLVCIGPVYRMAAAGGNLDEATAGGILDYLNHLRSTYGVAIVTEAHAAKAAQNEIGSNARRGLAPSGSGAWMRFPEVGCGLRLDVNASEQLRRKTYRLERWRGDRSPSMRFPNFIARGTGEQVWFDDVSEQLETMGAA